MGRKVCGYLLSLWLAMPPMAACAGYINWSGEGWMGAGNGGTTVSAIPSNINYGSYIAGNSMRFVSEAGLHEAGLKGFVPHDIATADPGPRLKCTLWMTKLGAAQGTARFFIAAEAYTPGSLTYTDVVTARTHGMIVDVVFGAGSDNLVQSGTMASFKTIYDVDTSETAGSPTNCAFTTACRDRPLVVWVGRDRTDTADTLSADVEVFAVGCEYA